MLTRRLVVCHSRLYEMARAIKLVFSAVSEYFIGSNLLKSGIEISVVALSVCHAVNKFVNKLFVFAHGIAVFFHDVGDRLYPLGDVRIVKNMRFPAVFQIIEP